MAVATSPHTLTEEMIGDIFTTAADPGYGGSEFWADFIKIKPAQEIVHRDFEDSSGNTYRGESLLNGAWFAVGERADYDEPSETVWHPLDKTAMARGIRKAAEHYRQTIEQFFEDHDAGTADVALQFAVLGDIVYG